MNKQQTMKALQEAILLYEENLANKKILILYEVDKEIQKLEIIFKRNNFLHLTGIKIQNSNLNPTIFYKKLLNQRLSLSDFNIKSDGTTQLKIQILNQISTINKFINTIGKYQANRKFLIADRVIGNHNICLCLKNIGDFDYVPISALQENIKNITDMQYKIICIATKPLKDKIYSKLTYISKNNTNYNTLEKVNKLYEKCIWDKKYPVPNVPFTPLTYKQHY